MTSVYNHGSIDTEEVCRYFVICCEAASRCPHCETTVHGKQVCMWLELIMMHHVSRSHLMHAHVSSLRHLSNIPRLHFMLLWHGHLLQQNAHAQISAVFKKADEAGVTLLNSATFYGADNLNEKTIAQCSGGKFQVSLKVGAIGDLNSGPLTHDASRENIRKQVDEACKILGVDCLDLAVQARTDPKTPVEDFMKTCKELIEEGVCILLSALHGMFTMTT